MKRFRQLAYFVHENGSNLGYFVDRHAYFMSKEDAKRDLDRFAVRKHFGSQRYKTLVVESDAPKEKTDSAWELSGKLT